MTDNRTTELLRKLRKMLDGCRRTETVGFDTYWITADTLDSSLDELEQAIAATLGSGTCEIALARLVDVAAKTDIDSCAEILECVEAIRKAVKR